MQCAHRLLNLILCVIQPLSSSGATNSSGMPVCANQIRKESNQETASSRANAHKRNETAQQAQHAQGQARRVDESQQLSCKALSKHALAQHDTQGKADTARLASGARQTSCQLSARQAVATAASQWN